MQTLALTFLAPVGIAPGRDELFPIAAFRREPDLAAGGLAGLADLADRSRFQSSDFLRFYA